MIDQRKRLIEQWLPINQVSTEAIRERAALSAMPAVNYLHVWWARRPLVASRAAILLSMLPSDVDGLETRTKVFETLGTSPEIHQIAERLSLAASNDERDNDGYRGNKRAFLHNPTKSQIAWIRSYISEPTTTVLDLTAGGGSIPFEASRLGFKTIANELNPVACLILRATCEWPQKFGFQLLQEYQDVSRRFLSKVREHLTHVYPEDTQPDCSTGGCPHPQRYRCSYDCEEPDSCGHQKLGSRDHYGAQAQRYAQTYLWARTVNCPTCESEIPLSPNWRLDSSGTGIQLESTGKECRFKIIHNRRTCSQCRRNNPKQPCNTATLHQDGEISKGTTSRAVAVCQNPNCGTTTPKGYLSKEAQLGRMGHRLYTIIYRDSWHEKTKSGREKKRPTTFRGFCEVSPNQDNRVLVEGELARLEPSWEENDILPSEEVPTGNDQRPQTYGMEKWVKMFGPRQLLANGHCVESFQECVSEDRQDGRLTESRKAAWANVGLALDRIINRNSLMCIWDPGTNRVAQSFSTHDFSFKWSYAEMAVTCQGLGLEWSLKESGKAIRELIEMTGNEGTSEQFIGTAEPTSRADPSTIINGEAQFIPHLEDNSIDCIVFDPPYEANVNYAELSDFFYVWLKRTAGYVFPEDFARHLSDKDLEAIASPARFHDVGTKAKSARELATADYEAKMAEIFGECRRVIKPDGIMTVMFTHKATAAWDALTVALINAGFSITRTWPVKTEAESSMHIKEKAAARTTILLVCRPRENNPTPQPWHRVEDLIAETVQEDIEDKPQQGRPEAHRPVPECFRSRPQGDQRPLGYREGNCRCRRTEGRVQRYPHGRSPSGQDRSEQTPGPSHQREMGRQPNGRRHQVLHPGQRRQRRSGHGVRRSEPAG